MTWGNLKQMQKFCNVLMNILPSASVQASYQVLVMHGTSYISRTTLLIGHMEMVAVKNGKMQQKAQKHFLAAFIEQAMLGGKN